MDFTQSQPSCSVTSDEWMQLCSELTLQYQGNLVTSTNVAIKWKKGLRQGKQIQTLGRWLDHSLILATEQNSLFYQRRKITSAVQVYFHLI